MRKRKKMDTRYKLLIIGSIIIIILAFLIYIVKTERKLNPFEKVIKDSVLSVCSLFTKPVTFVKERLDGYDKYKKIEAKYDELNLDKAKLEELQKENAELKKLLNLQNTLSEYDKVNASVVNRNVGYWYNTITINKGESSGIKKDMAVITSEGLIGKVVSTSYLHSTIKLLSSDELGQKVSIKIKVSDEKYVYGLLSSYNQKDNVFIIEGISENVLLTEGMLVTTTGMSNIFPSGIVVGTVKGVTTDNFDLTKLVLVHPSSDFDDIEYVSVLKRKSEVE